MTKLESRKSGVVTGKSAYATPAVERVSNGTMEPGSLDQSAPIKAKVIKQTSREMLHRKNTECEVYDDGTNTFFW